MSDNGCCLDQGDAYLKLDRRLEATLTQFLRQTTKAGVFLGLDQSRRLLAAVGEPHRAVPMVHVAGTNGKGSVCAYVASALRQAGYRVGRYTSPHLVSWTERICIDDQPIAPQKLLDLLTDLQQTAAHHGLAPTQFELVTAAAWLHFAQQKVDVAVMEVGLGGRLDATNVCDRPLATTITSIGRDHWQRLGPTLADIAREKAGIFKPGVPAAIAPLPPEAAAVVRNRAAAVDCPLVWVTPSAPSPTANSPTARFLPPSPEFSPLTYPLALPGAHQYSNSAVAIALLQLLRQQGWEIPDDAIQAGMAQVSWPARLQWMRWRGRPLLVDGAHNAEAALVLRQYLDQTLGERPVSWVIGMLATKDHPAVLKALLRPGDRACFVPVPDHQSATPTDLKAIARAVCPQVLVQTAADGATGLDWAIAHASNIDSDPRQAQPVLCGSLYLIGHLLAQFAR
ncbi:MAG: folylpolyglutamate synthase/dihydrofolate synthase family protein [Cyanobacteria bacterium P01_A01_bin.135]